MLLHLGGLFLSWYHEFMRNATSDTMKSQRRRPTVTGEPVMVRIQPEMAANLDNWRRKQDDLPGRPEAIRRLIEIGLNAETTTAADTASK